MPLAAGLAWPGHKGGDNFGDYEWVVVMMMMMIEAGTSVSAVARVSWRAWVRAVIRSSLGPIISNSHNLLSTIYIVEEGPVEF